MAGPGTRPQLRHLRLEIGFPTRRDGVLRQVEWNSPRQVQHRGKKEWRDDHERGKSALKACYADEFQKLGHRRSRDHREREHRFEQMIATRARTGAKHCAFHVGDDCRQRQDPVGTARYRPHPTNRDQHRHLQQEHICGEIIHRAR